MGTVEDDIAAAFKRIFEARSDTQGLRVINKKKDPRLKFHFSTSEYSMWQAMATLLVRSFPNDPRESFSLAAQKSGECDVVILEGADPISYIELKTHRTNPWWYAVADLSKLFVVSTRHLRGKGPMYFSGIHLGRSRNSDEHREDLLRAAELVRMQHVHVLLTPT